MGERAEIQKINTWLSFYYIEYDTSPPEIIEGRVHPIQFSNSVTRVNAAGRSFRDKKLFLQIMFCLGLAVIVVYPFFDTDYYLPIILLFSTLMLFDYVYYCWLETKTARLLLDVAAQENDLFRRSGMYLSFHPYGHVLEIATVSPSTPQRDLNMPQDTFQRLHTRFSQDVAPNRNEIISNNNTTPISTSRPYVDPSYRFPLVNATIDLSPPPVKNGPTLSSSLPHQPTISAMKKPGKRSRRVSINEDANTVRKYFDNEIPSKGGLGVIPEGATNFIVDLQPGFGDN